MSRMLLHPFKNIVPIRYLQFFTDGGCKSSHHPVILSKLYEHHAQMLPKSNRTPTTLFVLLLNLFYCLSVRASEVNWPFVLGSGLKNAETKPLAANYLYLPSTSDSRGPYSQISHSSGSDTSVSGKLPKCQHLASSPPTSGATYEPASSAPSSNHTRYLPPSPSHFPLRRPSAPSTPKHSEEI